MMISGEFIKDLPNSSLNVFRLSNVHASDELLISGGDFWSPSGSSGHFGSKITISGDNDSLDFRFQPISGTRTIRINSGEKINLEIKIQDKKYDYLINEIPIGNGDFSGNPTLFSFSGSGMNFSPQFYINHPNISISASSTGNVTQRSGIFNIFPDPSLNIRITGVMVTAITSDGNSAQSLTNFPSGLNLPSSGYPITITQAALSGSSGMFESLWLSYGGPRINTIQGI
jgi:hypothetical protein